MNIRSMFLACSLILLVFAGTTPATADSSVQRFAGQTLHILNWSDYLDPDLVAGFEKTFGVTVKHSYYETDDHRDKIFAESGTLGFDLVMLDTASVPAYVKRGWISTIDRDAIANLRHVGGRCQSSVTTAGDYTVPYHWGTLGIAYRTDLVDEPITRWMQLYRPSKSLRGRIIMIDDSLDVLGMAVKALGGSMASEDAEVWEQAGRLAQEQQPHVLDYGSINLDKSSALLSGEVVATQIYNGEVLMLQEYSDDIAYAHPQEGSSYWVDRWALVAGAPHRELAHAFLNFINNPDLAAKNAQFVYFATCNKAAEALLPGEFLKDPIIYPPENVMKVLEPYANHSPRLNRKINMLYSQISGGR